MAVEGSSVFYPLPPDTYNTLLQFVHGQSQHTSVARVNEPWSIVDEEGYPPQIELSVGDYVIVTEEYRNGWSVCYRVDHELHSDVVGYYPTAFLSLVHLPDRPGKDAEGNIYEQWYRQQTISCTKCEKEMGYFDSKYNWLDIGSSYEECLCPSCYVEFGSQILEEMNLPSTLQPFPFAYTGHWTFNHWTILGTSAAITLRDAFLLYKDRPCLGSRHLLEDGHYDIKFSFKSFGEVYELVHSFGSGLKNIVDLLDLSDLSQDVTKFIGMVTIGTIEYYISEYACLFYGMVSSPIQRTKVENDYTVSGHIINNSEMCCIISQKKFVNDVLHISDNSPSLKIVIQYESTPFDEDTIRLANEKNIKLYTFSDVIAIGEQFPIQGIIYRSPDDIATIVYTSGSTGIPKGAIITDENWLFQISKAYYVYHPGVVLSHAPVSHMSDRLNVTSCILNGGRVGVISGGVDQLFHDFQALQPTILSSTPRLFTVLYTEYNTELLEGNSSEEELLKKYKSMISDRLIAITVGGAMTSPAVFEFMKKCFDNIVVNNGYASTECGPISWIEAMNVDENGKMSFEGVDMVLRDVPIFNYFSTDKPHPRGEIMVKSKTVIPGYYRNKQKNEESFIEGWFATGDVGELNLETGKLTIIDRIKNIFKLSQGEFIAPEILEGLYIKSEFVSQIFVEGHPSQSYVLAVIIPNEKVVEQWFASNGIEYVDFESACQNQDLKNEILNNIKEIGIKAGVPEYEIPPGIILSHVPFTPENGQLTSTLKTVHPILRIKYKERIADLYTELEAKHISQTLKNIISQEFGEEGDFVSLGGDSLQAAKISSLLKERGVDVSAAMLMESDSLDSIARKSAEKNRFIDPLRESRFPDSISIDSDIESINAEVEDILLTGVTGFLGIHLLKELVEIHPNANIHCIVRANSPDHALERIQNKVQESTLRIDISRIVAVKGDLSQDRLGLSVEAWEEYSDKIDMILHNGAMVNMVMSYSSLKEANVGSVFELLKLAGSRKLKPLHYVSTIGVLGRPSSKTLENVPVIETSGSQFPHFSGYSQSKLVAEMVVQQAGDRGWPVTILRPPLIGGNGETGYLNITDWFTRYLVGIITAKLAPFSEYLAGFIPVDELSRRIVTIISDENCYEKRVFTFIPSETQVIQINDMVEAIKSFGIEIAQYPQNEWYAKMLDISNEPDEENKDNVIFPVLNYFSQGFPDSRYLLESMDNTNVKELSKGIEEVSVTPELIQVYLRYLRENNII
eukprot:TRINITY_DN11550_c0_g1_i1.p1 TRINITY_DN11550_c0_g1~~TRINITY_DN11550_c0_g1_i1.p1  ORF type:complete len:1249 (+),score=274.47 TRINITY_DN11550_c0_g1_i1:28-3774(+)